MSDDAITCEGRLESLTPLLAFVDRESAAAGAGRDAAFALRLAVEEVCTNIITHGYGGGAPEPVTVRMQHRPGAVVVTIEDRAPPFDPADAPAADVTAGWSTRRIGGMGWHLVRELMDEVHHEPAPAGGNRITLIKNLAEGSGPTPS